MEFKKILNEHNVSLNHFKKLVKVGSNSLDKYKNGEKIKENVRRKIELGLLVLEKYDLVCPKLDGKDFVYSFYDGKYDLHCKNVAKYDRRFEEYYNLEMIGD